MFPVYGVTHVPGCSLVVLRHLIFSERPGFATSPDLEAIERACARSEDSEDRLTVGTDFHHDPTTVSFRYVDVRNDGCLQSLDQHVLLRPVGKSCQFDPAPIL